MTATIVSDRAIRTTIVYDPDTDELSEDKARAVASRFINPDRWVFIDCEHIQYNRVAVRFQRR